MVDTPNNIQSNIRKFIDGALDATGLNTIDLPGNLPEDYTLGQSKYDFTYRVFPANLGNSSYNGHYMIININVSNFSNFEGVQADGNNVNTFTRLSGELSKVDTLRQNIDPGFTANGKTLGPGNTFIPRQTRRIVEAIALYMPNTVQFTQANQYEDISLTDIAASPVTSMISSLGISNPLGNAETVAGLAQSPVNPRVEVIFSNTALRQFQFDFLFAPVNESESLAVDQIIRTLRLHAAPEVSKFSFGNNALDFLRGLLWTAPSEFDITFYNKGEENRALPRINTCVLENLDVDMAPSGVYSTFSTGYPVKIRLQLRFREVEVLHRLRVLQGF